MDYCVDCTCGKRIKTARCLSVRPSVLEAARSATAKCTSVAEPRSGGRCASSAAYDTRKFWSDIVTLPSVWQRGEEYCEQHVRGSVCLSISISPELHIRTSLHFQCLLPWSSIGDDVFSITQITKTTRSDNSVISGRLHIGLYNRTRTNQAIYWM